ncbi:MAG TPA: nickel pincer cofactor biosynthesis protein LarC [Mycobacteriales bacterium]|nr:nickel pincer cofactor biosynthesis protein LarC [Mycobacteriales bacterium]
MSRIGWLDCSSGVSGDMLLGALADLGALDGLTELVDSLGSLEVQVRREPTTRAGLRAIAVTVEAPADQPHRHLADVLAIVERAAVPAEVRERAASVFTRLAEAEARVHGVSAEQVEFHEVGAVDSIVDVIAACLGLHTLGLDRLITSPVALGGGVVQTAHGSLPVPAPAVLELLVGTTLATSGGGSTELATPTGIALLVEWAAGTAPMPVMRVAATGVGAGSRDLAERPNVVRLVVGESVEEPADGEWLVVEANVDDLDPRLWPGVIARLLQAGAADAWLTPIVMKKGRPAHTLSALTEASAFPAVRKQMFAETSTIGVRWHAVGKHALDREVISVEIDGLTIRVKLAFDGSRMVSAAPEFDDVAAAAGTLGVPVKEMLAAANAAVRNALMQPREGGSA